MAVAGDGAKWKTPITRCVHEFPVHLDVASMILVFNQPLDY